MHKDIVIHQFAVHYGVRHESNIVAVEDGTMHEPKVGALSA